MIHLRPGLAAAAVFAGAAALALAGDVVVLKGGGVIPLKEPWVRRGNTAYLTRSDGTRLSVPVSEIDREATAAAQTSPVSSPPVAEEGSASTPADAARAVREGPKARVRITDSDVSHPLEYSNMGPEAKPADEKRTLIPGEARVEIANYDQVKDGTSVVVSGQLRNPTQQVADAITLRVTAIDEKGEAIDAASASLSNGVIESGSTINFTAKLNIGERILASFRFAPTWRGPKPTPAPSNAGAGAGGQSAGSGQRAPAPAPTPYGRGTLYAAPVPNAPSEAPADGRTGYIPGASSPSNQPKPPTF